jgi:ABC-type uncharacterized transport system substrate-binding protein
MMTRICTALAALVLSAGTAAAHPHIFIDTALEVIIDADHRATAVRVVWVYDDFYSLLMLQDRGLDPDGDAKLTPEEEVKLSGFDMAWDADFAGDLYLLDKGTVPVAMGRPRDWSARVEQGRIVSVHVRDITVPVAIAAGPLVLQVYDPTYYTGYTILGTPLLSGPGAAGCSVQVFEPDLTAAQEQLQAMLQEYTADQSVEQDFPAVGAEFAEEARVTCATD